MHPTDDILNDAHDAVLAAVRARFGDHLGWDKAVAESAWSWPSSSGPWTRRPGPNVPAMPPHRPPTPGPPGPAEPQRRYAVRQQSSVEWTDGTWNFVIECDKLSPGCAGCYAVKDVLRMAGNPTRR
jgi:hypothetical protein